MWLNLERNLQYRFEEKIDPAVFFRELPCILAESDVLVLGCYDARSDIREFLTANAIPPAWQRFNTTETWDLNREEHPNGAAFHLHPTADVLRGLIDFAGSVSRHIDLCDHIAAYSAEHPLLIYHGTFWEPLFVTTRIPRSSVEAFSRGIGSSFEEIDFGKCYG